MSTELRNASPCEAAWTLLFDQHGAEQAVVCLRASWLLDPASGGLTLEAKPPPLRTADVYAGEPGQSTLLAEAEFGLPKPATDVVLIASAHPRPGASRVDVTLTAGPLRQSAIVLGPRRWQRGLFGWRATEPEPLAGPLPLHWESAAGGSDASAADPAQHAADERNPIGAGFRTARSTLPRREQRLPQIVAAVGSDRPVGFAFLPPHWQPRRRYAGTYDKAWLHERCPVLPLDFDPRFFNNAAPGLTAEGHLRGDEAIAITGCTPSGELSFRLPGHRPVVMGGWQDRADPVPSTLATVRIDLIDPARPRLELLWRAAVATGSRLERLRALLVTWEAPA